MNYISFIYKIALLIVASSFCVSELTLAASFFLQTATQFFAPRSCIRPGSILDQPIPLKTLVVLLDAYPTDTTYNEATGKHSQVHDLLKSYSTSFTTRLTLYPSTFYSLQYLLGKNKYLSSNCLYPDLGSNNPPLRLIFGDDSFFTGSGFCTRRYNLSRLLSMRLFAPTQLCNLADIEVVNNFISHYANKSQTSVRVTDVIHDFSFHSIHELNPQLLSSCRTFSSNHWTPFPSSTTTHSMNTPTRLALIDSCLADGLKKTITSLYSNYDTIIVMSDHGPRYLLNPNNQPRSLSDIRAHSTSSTDPFFTYFAYIVKNTRYPDPLILLPPNPSPSDPAYPLNYHHQMFGR